MKKIFYILPVVFFLCIGATLYFNNNIANLDGNGVFSCASIKLSDPYGYSGYFNGQSSPYTLDLTDDVWVQITNGTNTMITTVCGKAWTESGDTLICSEDIQNYGTFEIRGQGAINDDYQIRMYDVTAGAQVPLIWCPFSAAGNNNYAGASMALCFCGASGHRYVFQMMNTSDSDDFDIMIIKIAILPQKFDGSCP